MKFKIFNKNAPIPRKWDKFYAVLPRRVDDESVMMFAKIERRRVTYWHNGRNRSKWEYREIMCPLTRRRLMIEARDAQQAEYAQEEFENGWDVPYGQMQAHAAWLDDGVENVPNVVQPAPAGMWQDVDGNLNQIPDAAPVAAIERA